MLNDADAAGVAEQAFGAARKVDGVVLLITLGTGIGSALFVHGELVPNTELGHVELHGVRRREVRRPSRPRAREPGLGRVGRAGQRVPPRVENLFWPDLFIVGGGISKEPDPWLPLIECRTKIVPARLRNKAGIVGAALQAQHGHKH